MEQGTKTGQLFLGSKFAGVASTATALCGTGFPPCPAYDFSCAFSGTLARTVEPGEKAVPAKLKGDPAPSAVSVEITFSVTISRATKSNLFKSGRRDGLSLRSSLLQFITREPSSRIRGVFASTRDAYATRSAASLLPDRSHQSRTR